MSVSAGCDQTIARDKRCRGHRRREERRDGVASRAELAGEPDRCRAQPIDMGRVHGDNVFAELAAIEQPARGHQEISFVVIEWRNDMERRREHGQAGDRGRNRQAAVCRILPARCVDGGHALTSSIWPAVVLAATGLTFCMHSGGAPGLADRPSTCCNCQDHLEETSRCQGATSSMARKSLSII